jgi:hypothetical protein
MRKAKQFTLRLRDGPGVLGELASSLWGKGVNIRAFMGDVRNGKANIHLMVDKPSAAKEIFADHGWNATEDTVAVLTLADKPGSLAVVASKLAKTAINIAYAYRGPSKAKGKINTYLAFRLPRRFKHTQRA